MPQSSPAQTAVAAQVAGASRSAASSVDRRLPLRVEATLVMLLLGTYLLLVNLALPYNSLTFDETAHLTCGYSVWATGDYRLTDGNHLPQRIMALPLLLRDDSFPPLDQQAWRQSIQFDFSQQFFFAMGNAPREMAALGRCVASLFGVLLGLVIWRWSRVLFGQVGGLLSLTLFAFDPGMLAHGGLATADLPAALALTLACFAFWRALQQLSMGRVLFSSVAMTAACLTKISCVLIIPIATAAVLLQLATNRPLQIRWSSCQLLLRSRLQRAAALAGATLAHGVVLWLLIWAFYGFRYETVPPLGQPHTPRVTWDELDARTGFVPAVVRFTRDHRLFPEAFIHSYGLYGDMIQGQRAFANGHYSMVGWRWFFPYAWLIKTPLPTIALLLVAAVVWFRYFSQRPRSLLLPPVPASPTANANATHAAPHVGLPSIVVLGLLLALYWTVAISSKFNIGHRHLLPIYPALFILAGIVGASWHARQSSSGSAPSDAVASTHASHDADHTSSTSCDSFSLYARRLALLLLMLLAVESLRFWPHQLSYFNQLAGGPANGYRHLVDSSFDWGQDLPSLRRWLDQHPSAQSVYFSYFGTANPAAWDIDQVRMLPSHFRRPLPALPEPLEPGVYCISATMLQAVWTPAMGPWCRTYEERYQLLAAEYVQLRAQGQEAAARLIEADAPLRQQMREFQELRFTRLCAMLRQRQPDDRAGYSILIYHLTQADLDQALIGPPAELYDTIQVLRP